MQNHHCLCTSGVLRVCHVVVCICEAKRERDAHRARVKKCMFLVVVLQV